MELDSNPFFNQHKETCILLKSTETWTIFATNHHFHLLNFHFLTFWLQFSFQALKCFTK